MEEKAISEKSPNSSLEERVAKIEGIMEEVRERLNHNFYSIEGEEG